MKTLIYYGTRYGATASTSEEIAKILHDEGFDIRVVNSATETMNDISEYELVVVGSTLIRDSWCKKPRVFLKKFKQELQKKKIALFVSSGTMSIHVAEGNLVERNKIYEKHLVNVAKRYHLKPLALGLFGGVWNFLAMGGITRRMLKILRIKMGDLGIQGNNEIYDTRNTRSMILETGALYADGQES